MSKKAKVQAVDRASAVLHQATRTDHQKVSVTREVSLSASKGPGWATAQDLQAAAKVWNQSADDIESNGKVISQLSSDLRTAKAKQLANRRAWQAARKQVLGTADVLCAGSADDLKAYGFQVRASASTAPGQAIVPPDHLVAAPPKVPGEVKVSWPKGGARHGFVVQHGVDVATATVSSPVFCPTVKYTLKGQPSGSVTYFRVAAIDPSQPTGLTAWSAWVSSVAR